MEEVKIMAKKYKEEIKVLSELANKAEIYKEDGYRGDYITYKINYDQEKVKTDLKAMQRQLTELQMAVERINLTALVEY